LGIGDWAQSPIPNPQSPIPNGEKNENINYQINITNNIFGSKNNKNKLLLKEEANNELKMVKGSDDKNNYKKIFKKIKIYNLLGESDITFNEYLFSINKNLNIFSKNLCKNNIKINFSDFKIDQEIFRNAIKKYKINLSNNDNDNSDHKPNKINDEEYFKKIINDYHNNNNNNKDKDISSLYNLSEEKIENITIDTKNKNDKENEDLDKNNNINNNNDFLTKSIYIYPIVINKEKEKEKEEYFFGEIKIDNKKYEKYFNIKNKDNDKNFTPIKTNEKINTINKFSSLFNFEGYGILVNSEKFQEGIFKNNELNGPGRIINKQGEIFCGNFLNSKLNNFGHYINNQGKYEGELIDNKRHGTGKEIFKDGSIYEGNYINNKKQGKGKFVWADGSSYEGEFYNDEINGKGNFRWLDNSYYEGQWKNGKIEGYGKLSFFNGQYYEGEFSENKKSGKGKYFYNSNRYFEGNWKNNLENGEGVLILGNKKHHGIWKDGKLLKKINIKKE